MPFPIFCSGSFAVRDHLRFNLGIICGPGSFAVPGSFAEPFRDPGANSGGEGKSQRATKKIGEEKSRAREKAPGDKILPDQFQTLGVDLASDWCQKIFVFFCPITGQLARSPFRVFLHGRVHKVNMSAIFSLLAHQRRRALFVEKLILQPPESSTKQRISYMRQKDLFREVLGRSKVSSSGLQLVLFVFGN